MFITLFVRYKLKASPSAPALEPAALMRPLYRHREPPVVVVETPATCAEFASRMTEVKGSASALILGSTFVLFFF